MKQKLLMLLAVLLTGGMLVACGPGDGTDETIGGGGGVVDEPLGNDLGADDTFGDDTAVFEDDTLGDDVAADDETVGADPLGDADAVDTTDDAALGEDAGFGDAQDTEVEGETVEMNLGDDAAVEGDDAAVEGEAEVDAEGEEVAGGGAAPAAGETIVVTFSEAAEGIAVENIQGAQDAEAIASTGEANPDLNLTVGQRYDFMYDGDGDLVFYNTDGEELLSTAGTEGAYGQDSEVAVEVEDGRLSFTLTDQLAQEIDRYSAGVDEQGGQVNAN
ncbi:MAG: hypothetical protein WD273_01960 [Trueperaceae bacterium]